jgi:hypothetical protein
LAVVFLYERTHIHTSQFMKKLLCLAAGLLALNLTSTFGQAEMIKAIRGAGRTPVQRNTFYEPIKVWEGETPAIGEDNRHSKILEGNLATA